MLFDAFFTLCPDMLVDVRDIFLHLKDIYCIGKYKYDTYVDKCHPEVTREKPSDDESKQHNNSRSDEISDNVACNKRKIHKLIKQEIHYRYYKRKPKQRKYKFDFRGDTGPDHRAGKHCPISSEHTVPVPV